MKGYWIQFEIETGEMLCDSAENDGRTGLYLSRYIEWWSRDGKKWERQPDWYQVFSSGTINPISRHSEREEAEAHYDDDYPGIEMNTWNDPIIKESHWSVDDAGIQRGFYIGDNLPDDPEFIELWEDAAQREE